MAQKLKFSLLVGFLFTLMIGVLTAQAESDPAVLSNIEAPRAQSTPEVTHPDASNNPSIRGMVYTDVNSDGVCVNSGVEGEGPIENINIDFVSSAGDKIATLQSGEDGTYGLVQVGQSYWEVTVDPDNTWVVTSQNPIYVPIGEDTPVQTGVNFCIQKADTYQERPELPIVSSSAAGSSTLLPEAGAAQSSGNTALVLLAMTGFGLLLFGVALKVKERIVSSRA